MAGEINRRIVMIAIQDAKPRCVDANCLLDTAINELRNGMRRVCVVRDGVRASAQLTHEPEARGEYYRVLRRIQRIGEAL
jgi:hypothetical protein